MRSTNMFAAGLVAVAVFATACSHNSSGPPVADIGSSANGPGSPSSSAPASALAFSQCLRSHGVRNFPDPQSSGGIPKVGPQQLGVGNAQFRSADTACAHLLQPDQAQVQEILSGMRDFAQCMRSHGVHNWPDPTVGADGQPVFDLQGPAREGGRVPPDQHWHGPLSRSPLEPARMQGARNVKSFVGNAKPAGRGPCSEPEFMFC